MVQVQVNNGDLRFIFKEYEDVTPIVYTLDNGGELEFVDDDFVALVLPKFEQQLNRGHIEDIELNNMDLIENDFVFNLTVDGQDINGRVNISSLDSKI